VARRIVAVVLEVGDARGLEGLPPGQYVTDD
jgi:hypothetical protein